VARVTSRSGPLPNEHGQVWRDYDITPYTQRAAHTERPEQAIVDWILRETGHEAWHGEAAALLSANQNSLSAFHTPQVQTAVAEIVDRFVSPDAGAHAFGLRIVTIRNPNWRAKALRLMKPVPIQSQGVQGWLLAREDAALLLSELRKRTDFREHSSPLMTVNNGQLTVISAVRPRTYVRGVIPSGDVWPGFNPEVAQIEEGYSLQFTPLLAIDKQTVDAVIKLQLNQVEKMVPVMLELPTAVAPRQRTRVEIPQMTMCNLHERFRWPTDQVLLLSMGVVASPGPSPQNPLTGALPLPASPARADALLLVESHGAVVTQASATQPIARGTPAGPNTTGRY
jgi:hypothetical protein